MNKFVILAFVASAIGAAVGEDWSDAAITVDTFNSACAADAELYDIMKRDANYYSDCTHMPIVYPNNKQAGANWCLFYQLSLLDEDEDLMKIDWDKTVDAYGSFGYHVSDCKDTDYDSDSGFWNNVGDWFFGEDFDWGTLNTAIGKFYTCITGKLASDANSKFLALIASQCPA